MTDFFETKAQDWDQQQTQRLLSQAIGEVMSSLWAPPMQKPVILDFGAGTGLLTEQMMPLAHHVIALDTSPAMLAQLRQKTDLSHKVSVYCQDILQQPLAETFDVIVSAMALHHVANTAALLKAFAAQLSPGGQILLADLDAEAGDFHPPEAEGVCHHGFDRVHLQHHIEQAGFERVQWVTAHTIHKAGKAYPIFVVSAFKR